MTLRSTTIENIRFGFTKAPAVDVSKVRVTPIDIAVIAFVLIALVGSLALNYRLGNFETITIVQE